MLKFVQGVLWDINYNEAFKNYQRNPDIIKLIEIGNDFGYVVVLPHRKTDFKQLPCKFQYTIIKNGPKKVEGLKIRIVSFQELLNGSDLVHQD